MEWDLLQTHFSKIQNLELYSGFNEEFNDRKLPSHWPLQRLLVADATGEVFQSPGVRQGRIGHLALFSHRAFDLKAPQAMSSFAQIKKPLRRGRWRVNI